MYSSNIKYDVHLEVNIDMNAPTIPLSDACRNLTDLITNVN